MEIRKFNPDEAEQVSAIIIANLLKYYGSAHDIAEYCQMYSPDNLPIKALDHETYVVTDGQNILATGSIKENQIWTLYVDQEKQHHGVGSQLLNALEQRIKANGFDQAVVFSGKHAVKFYEKQGYSLTGNIYSEGEDMKWLSYLIKEKI